MIVWTDYRNGYMTDLYARHITGEVPGLFHLFSFTARLTDDQRSVLLEWRTLTENNNYGFEVERRGAGASNFVTLQNSFVPGAGTTYQPQRYSYVDADVVPGEWWYRLKQIDLDQTIHYTETVFIGVTTGVKEESIPREFALHQNYPNPFNPSTTIKYELPQPSHVTLTVYDLLGREVATLVNVGEEPGYKSVKWNAVGVSTGVYFCRLSAGNFVQTKKMLLLK